MTIYIIFLCIIFSNVFYKCIRCNNENFYNNYVQSKYSFAGFQSKFSENKSFSRLEMKYLAWSSIFGNQRHFLMHSFSYREFILELALQYEWRVTILSIFTMKHKCLWTECNFLSTDHTEFIFQVSIFFQSLLSDSDTPCHHTMEFHIFVTAFVIPCFHLNFEERYRILMTDWIFLSYTDWRNFCQLENEMNCIQVNWLLSASILNKLKVRSEHWSY